MWVRDYELCRLSYVHQASASLRLAQSLKSSKHFDSNPNANPETRIPHCPASSEPSRRLFIVWLQLERSTGPRPVRFSCRWPSFNLSKSRSRLQAPKRLKAPDYQLAPCKVRQLPSNTTALLVKSSLNLGHGSQKGFVGSFFLPLLDNSGNASVLPPVLEEILRRFAWPFIRICKLGS